MNVLLVAGILLGASSIIAIIFKNEILCKILFLLGVVCVVIAWVIMLIILEKEQSYKKGQIDYHNGIIKYELKMQPDSTIIWEEIKKITK